VKGPLSQVTLLRITDDPVKKIVTAQFAEIIGWIPLWRGMDYDIMGDWTQEQARLQILKLLTTSWVVRPPKVPAPTTEPAPATT
jgi:hypothetical protein